MDDALLVTRAMAGDLDSFGQLYDRYFHRIYDFAWRILRDADEAADVTQDVFMKAMQGLPGLGKASSFKSWLFTIAHHTAVSRAERAGRTVPLPAPVHEEAFGSFDVPDPCRLDNPELAAGDHEMASLVWEAAAALNPRDYALLDLHVRQGLESAEIATVMGVSKGNAYTMVSRMKTAAADVIGSYVVARRGSKDCERLREVLAQHEFPPYTDEVRKAVDAHIKDCETCHGSRKTLSAPLEIFGAFAVVPAPLSLKGDIWRNVAGAWRAAGPGARGGGGAGETTAPLPASPYGPLAAAGAGGGGYDGAILPMTADDDGWDRRQIMLFAGAAIGLLVIAFGGGALLVSAFGGGGDNSSGGGVATRTPGATRSATARTAITPGVAVQTPTPDLTPSVTPTAAPTATEEAATSTPVPALPSSTPVKSTPTKTGQTPTREPSSTRTPKGGKTPTATPTCVPGPDNNFTCP